MPLSDTPKNFTQGSIRVINGTRTYTCVTDDGDFKATGLKRRLNALIKHNRRGRRFGESYGDREDPVITFSERILDLGSAADPGTLREILTGTGPYSADLGTRGTGRVYAVHIEYLQEGSDLGGTDETYRFEHCVPVTVDFAEGDANMHSFALDCRGDVQRNGVVIGREIAAGGT